MLLETRILAPGEKFPNFDELNAKCDKSEWRQSFGEEVGPWSGQHVVYFIDELYNKYSWPSPTTTVGSAICVREFADQIAMVRKFKDQLDQYGDNFLQQQILGHVENGRVYGEVHPHRCDYGGTRSLPPSEAQPPRPQKAKHQEGVAPPARDGLLPDEGDEAGRAGCTA